MQITNNSGSEWTMAVSGEVDADNCELLKDELLGSERVASDLTLDVSELTFLDSSGISTLLQVKSELEGAGHGFTLARPTSSVHRVLEITGLLEIFGLDAPRSQG